jgi:peptidoglycan hydrolase CwlO-like protein
MKGVKCDWKENCYLYKLYQQNKKLKEKNRQLKKELKEAENEIYYGKDKLGDRHEMGCW